MTIMAKATANGTTEKPKAADKDKPKPAAATGDQGAAGSGEAAAASEPTAPASEPAAAGAVQSEEAATVEADDEGDIKADPPEASGALQDGGPTLEEYVAAGYKAENYPPKGFKPVPSDGLTRYQAGAGAAGAAAATVEDADDEAPEPASRTLVPCNGIEATDLMRSLLLDACERFGIDPTQEVRPKELAAWNYYPGSKLDGVPNSVVVVTQGGIKLRHYDDPNYFAPRCTEAAMDEDTEATLARLHGAFTKDPKTKEVIRLALPGDVALPVQAVTGRVERTAHRFQRGYLREGGKLEANRRQKAEKKAKR